MRKHYLEGHTTGETVVFAAEALRSAAMREGERVEFHDGLAVLICGEATEEQVRSFVASSGAFVERMQQAA